MTKLSFETRLKGLKQDFVVLFSSIELQLGYRYVKHLVVITI